MFYGKLKVFSHSKIQSRILFCRQRSIICTLNTKPIITMSIVAKLKILVVSTHSTVFRGFNILFNIFPENDIKIFPGDQKSKPYDIGRNISKK